MPRRASFVEDNRACIALRRGNERGLEPLQGRNAVVGNLEARAHEMSKTRTGSAESPSWAWVATVLAGWIRPKQLQSEALQEQAANNSKEQFASSPDLSATILDAVIEAFDAHQKMSGQALDSQRVREGIRDTLLGPGQLWERLKERA